MQFPPDDVLESWPEPNYENPSEVRGPAILVLTFIFVPLLVILVLLRVYTRLRLTKNFGPDDITIVAAVFPTLACATITVYGVLHCGWGRHVWDVTLYHQSMSLRLSMALEILFSIACTLTRVSMLLLVLRIMATGRGILRSLAIGSMVFLCMEVFIFCIVAIDTCSPVSDYWTFSSKPQKCINEAAHILAAGIINTLSDFCVVLIPIPVVLKLKLPLRQRIFCAMLFGAGFVVCIAGGVRIAYMYQLNTSYDKTWLAYPTWICGTIELYLGIMATTIPAIKPLVTRYFPTFLGHNFSRYAQSSNGHMKSMDPFTEQSLKSHQPATCDEFVRTASAELDACEKVMTQPESSNPLALQPVVSAFSTYRKDSAHGKDFTQESDSIYAKELPATPAAGREIPHHLDVLSLKSSISSFHALWIP